MLLGHREPVIAGLVAAGLLGFVGWSVGPRFRWRRGWATFSCAFMGLVFGFTIVRTGMHLPSFDGNGAFWSTCRRNPGVTVRGSQDLLNLLMLAPLAFGVTLASRSCWKGLATAIGVIVLVEVGQSIFGTGLCEAGDATRNLIGASLGTAAAWCIVLLRGQRADAA